MKTQFDKIYVLSLITNKDRQEFITYQMNELGLDFEFVYGLDFYNLKYDKYGNAINYPKMLEPWENDVFNNDKAYGCAMTHYRAIMQAYYLNYNNVLIIEDDICFIKNKQLIEHYLNNLPQDADFITYTARFRYECEVDSFKKELQNNINNDLIQIKNEYHSLCGGMMYGIMNRDTMKLYLESKRQSLQRNDHTIGIFIDPTIIRYTPIKSICTDQYNLFLDNDQIHFSYVINNLLDKSNIFYKPIKFNDDLSNIKN